ncbi:polyphosphate polymerase domain-containing protein [candidate division KSB1 bacterium]|nr:polyphosphate polymerase domain-containing protein [candidate division KSB1 bacterium]
MRDLSEIRRYELKYTITEEQAVGIREYIKNFCTLDSHVPDGENSYIVNNLYFDTPDLLFYYDTKFRKVTRYKSRARFYGLQASDRIWPEVKYRRASVIWKHRYSVPIDQWPKIFSPRESDHKQPHFKEQLDSFDDLIYWYGAQPKLHVRYVREPYVTDLEEYGRITFDRELCYRATRDSIDLAYREEDMIYYDDPATAMCEFAPVILEIKVERLVPVWAVELIRKFNLIQRGFSKYCYGIDYILGYCEDGRNSIFRWTG